MLCMMHYMMLHFTDKWLLYSPAMVSSVIEQVLYYNSLEILVPAVNLPMAYGTEM